MPDLLTHSLAVYPLKHKYPKFISIILLGAVLPDVVARIPGILFPHQSTISWFQVSLHTPVSLLLISLLLSFFFSEKQRRTIFFWLLTGVAIHLFLDLFQKSLLVGYFWLFPFSFKSFWIPLIWPNDTVFLIPILILGNLLFSSLFLKIRENDG